MPAKIIQRNSKPMKKVKVDSVTIDIIESALRNARFEMDTVLFRTAMSPGIREQHDEFPMIANLEGKMVVGQFGSFIWGFMQGYDGTVEEGDVFLTNDPYSVNGAISHQNDWLMLMPVYKDGRIIAWSAMFGHMTDVGGKVPGSLPTDARTIYEEGVSCAAGQDHQGRQSCRTTCSRSSCTTAGCRPGISRTSTRSSPRCARRHPLRRDRDALRRRRVLFGHGCHARAQQARDARADPAHGAGEEAVLRGLHLRRRPRTWARTRSPARCGAKGDKCIFDFTGTDPQSISSINFLLNEEMFKMFAGVYMIMVFDPQILFNDGFYDLMDVRIPPGTLLKPLKPAALSCRTHALGRIFDILGGLLGQGNPAFMCAAGFSDSPHFMYSGYDQNGEWYQLYQITFGGIPGKPFGDGPDGHSLWPSFTNVPNEFLESYFPLRIDTYETIPDTGGAGKNRGGNGLRIGYRFLEPGEISIHDDRWLTYPWGVNGGLPGARSKKTLVRGRRHRASCCRRRSTASRSRAGDLLLADTWGGGGCGDPFEREVEKVVFDVQAGLVTPRARVATAWSFDDDLTADVRRDERAAGEAARRRASP